MSDFEKLINASDLIEWIIESDPDWCVGAVRSIVDHVEEMPAAQPEPCEDAVNRETILKFFDGWMSALDENCHNQSVSDLKIIKRDFANLPSVTPKQRTGKWIKLDMHRGMADHKCSVCKQECYVPTCMGEPMYAFCPNCGADMRGEQNG